MRGGSRAGRFDKLSVSNKHHPYNVLSAVGERAYDANFVAGRWRRKVASTTSRALLGSTAVSGFGGLFDAEGAHGLDAGGAVGGDDGGEEGADRQGDGGDGQGGRVPGGDAVELGGD